MKKFLKSKQVKRLFRVLAFGFGAGVTGLGAGNLWGFGALESAGFGATLAVLGLVAALSWVYAGKGEVPDQEFDRAVNDAIETVRSKSSKEEK